MIVFSREAIQFYSFSSSVSFISHGVGGVQPLLRAGPPVGHRRRSGMAVVKWTGQIESAVPPDRLTAIGAAQPLQQEGGAGAASIRRASAGERRLRILRRARR